MSLVSSFFWDTVYYVCSLAHYAYRHRIGIGLQQKIDESVSVESDVLGLTLTFIKGLSD